MFKSLVRLISIVALAVLSVWLAAVCVWDNARIKPSRSRPPRARAFRSI